MKKRLSVIALLLAVVQVQLWAQGGTQTTKLDATTNGTTINFSPSTGFILSDDDAGDSRGRYSRNKDYRITVCGSCQAPLRLGFTFSQFDVAPGDTLFIYDGNSINAPCLAAANNNNSIEFRTFFTSNLNSSGCLTLRFKTNADTAIGTGFLMSTDCSYPCELITPVIEETYFKQLDGVIIETRQMNDYNEYDTAMVVDPDFGDTTMDIQTTTYHGAVLCFGECLVLKAHGDYHHDYGAYNPTDATTTFRWDFGNGDTLVGIGPAAMTGVACYRQVDCYDITLSLTDSAGCESTTSASIRVRLAQNPIKTIYDLANICSSDSLLVNADYNSNSTITLAPIAANNVVSKTNPAKTFIPDGPNCPTQCYRAPVNFNEFPRGRAVQSKEDICSICINYEHEFMGDYELSIICPTQRKAVLKYKNAPTGMPAGTGAGSGTFNGYPYGGNSHHSYDTSPICDSLSNMYGDGLDYCFSRNSSYILVTGVVASDPAATVVSNNYMGHTGSAPTFIDQVSYTFGTIPAPYLQAGQTCGTQSFSTKHPSDHANKFDYYLPADDFSQLVGCPLNGQWDVEICDSWGSDNGWVFNWSLDICGISSGAGCHYQVALDTIIWTPDTSYADFDLGHYRGAVVRSVGHDNLNYVSTPDTAGTFPIKVRLIDEFGCIWDTATKITSTWTPAPDLGPDRVVCDVEYAVLDAKDRHTASCNYKFMWEPTGSNNDTIHTMRNVGSSTLYTVAVYNEMNNLRCEARDSVRVHVYMQPVPNFDPGVFPLEGCEPFTINITNTSQYATNFRWEFGDGAVSYSENPSHSYSAGTYDFRLYVSTPEGCNDSLVYKELITVYSSPKAGFSWNPVNPTILHPSVQFANHTDPQSPENIYRWEIQYDKDNPESYHTLTDVNPTFEWSSPDGTDFSSRYKARLIARTEQLGPSGNLIVCADTAESTILLINDFLQFPSVVTPNGDGINDKFIINNLIEGLGFPYNSLAVYNRWGERVFYKENIASEEDFWDPGKDNTPAGTYFYRFSGKGYLGNVQRTGTVEVLR
ncbi:MAG: gliding motility-associated C-terminal domain-containing protein [Bacteroidales bacterium]|nr:gliding motility-associated C-terminal domain-containing protein [Bacteroidales bacterium]